MGETKH